MLRLGSGLGRVGIYYVSAFNLEEIANEEDETFEKVALIN
jgi:hypothetical protein